MNKTKIEWCDYTWNPVVGCKRGCPYCYAKRIFQRFHKTEKFEDLKFYPKRLSDPYSKKEPAKIFVGSMTDICYWEPKWVEQVLAVIKQCPQHTFMFLTKDTLAYERHKFPLNCWLGMTNTEEWIDCRSKLYKLLPNKRFLSIEPLINKINHHVLGNIWELVIVGGLTPHPVHKKEWVDNIIRHCDHVKIPYFLKNNLHYKK